MFGVAHRRTVGTRRTSTRALAGCCRLVTGNRSGGAEFNLSCESAAPGAQVEEERERHATDSYPATGADGEAPAGWRRLLRDQVPWAGRAQFAAVEQGDGFH